MNAGWLWLWPCLDRVVAEGIGACVVVTARLWTHKLFAAPFDIVGVLLEAVIGADHLIRVNPASAFLG